MMSTADISQCAACGKDGNDLKACTSCKLVKYCNVACQKSHRPKHKKECRRRAAELFDEVLFQQPPPKEDCPICFLPLQFGQIYGVYQPCCGKILCRGCCHAVEAEMINIMPPCPFCRTPAYNLDEDVIERCKKRMEANDAEAFMMLGWLYHEGDMGLPQDLEKAIGLFLRGAELGSINAHYHLGLAYYNGDGVEKDTKKAKHYWERAAIGGHDAARHCLGVLEGNHNSSDNRAKKHLMIAASAGYDNALKTIRDVFMAGYVTKEEYEKTLRAHKDSQDEMKSDWRDTAFDIYLKDHSSL